MTDAAKSPVTRSVTGESGQVYIKTGPGNTPTRILSCDQPDCGGRCRLSLVEQLTAAGHDERLSSGTLYLDAAKALAAERALSDALAEALRELDNGGTAEGSWRHTKAALSRYDAARGPA